MTPRIAVAGAAGRMGRMLVAALRAAPDLRLTAALEHARSPHIRADAGEVAGVGRAKVRIGASLEAALPRFDVLVDFSHAAAVLYRLPACIEAGKGIVIGATGFDARGRAAIAAAAEGAPIVLSPNMSVGVNVVFRLVAAAAQALGEDVDIEVLETHHRDKVDAPSGTAMRIGEILATTLGRDLATDAVYGREGDAGPRRRGAIGFHSQRAGDVVGEHTVTFAGAGERIEITHRASSRENFAAGAVRAARFVARRLAAGDIGLFGMEDVLADPDTKVSLKGR